MKCNVGKTDKLARFILAIILIAVGHITEIYLLNAVGAIVLATGYFSFCGMYKFFGINTCKSPEVK